MAKSWRNFGLRLENGLGHLDLRGLAKLWYTKYNIGWRVHKLVKLGLKYEIGIQLFEWKATCHCLDEGGDCWMGSE